MMVLATGLKHNSEYDIHPVSLDDKLARWTHNSGYEIPRVSLDDKLARGKKIWI